MTAQNFPATFEAIQGFVRSILGLTGHCSLTGPILSLVLDFLKNTRCSLMPFTLFRVKEVNYTSLSESRGLSSQHFPRGLIEKRFANVAKQHASPVSRHF